jgi:hypothetical protein
MPILRWCAAHGDAPIVHLETAHTVHLAPFFDAVDSNIVHVEGEGTIESFGWGERTTKRVLFEAGITLKHSTRLQLLSLQDREIREPAIGIYTSETFGYWNEIFFTGTGAAEVTRRLEKIERQLEAIAHRLDVIENDESVVWNGKHHVASPEGV